MMSEEQLEQKFAEWVEKHAKVVNILDTLYEVYRLGALDGYEQGYEDGCEEVMSK